MQTITPLQMLQNAVESGADMEKMKALMDLSDRWEQNEARKAFVAAMAGFRGEAVEIIKTRNVNYKNKTGGTTSYKHAELADAVEAAVPALSKWGLSHQWNTEQSEGGLVTVTCFLTHRDGHSESTSLLASPDTTGSKNSIQAIGSTISYLERYTFLAITGLAAKGMDDDGGPPAEPAPTINGEQAKQIKKLLKDVGRELDPFLEWAGADKIEDISIENFNYIVPKLKKAIEDSEAQ